MIGQQVLQMGSTPTHVPASILQTLFQGGTLDVARKVIRAQGTVNLVSPASRAPLTRGIRATLVASRAALTIRHADRRTVLAAHLSILIFRSAALFAARQC